MKRTTSRSAGILLPVTSLPSRYGVGTLGREARRWVDFLAEAGQSWWQVLPLGPTGYADSPYQSFSTFAGNPYLIDLEQLCRDGLLLPEELAGIPFGEDIARVDYGLLFRHREGVLRKACARLSTTCLQDGPELARFRRDMAGWLPDYALYMALKQHMQLRPWTEWDAELRLREPAALARWRETLYDDIEYHVKVQYLFFEQWHTLKAYANSKGVKIIGDIPIYVAMDSADAWSRSALFQLDHNGLPIAVTGVPPDGFSDDGQLWGNPLYRWDAHRADGYQWWTRRLHACMQLYDMLRIDHFRGLESYFAIPFGSKTAATGAWQQGPGMEFVSTVNAALGDDANIIAEDLGFLTPAVRALLDGSGYPGMKVLQFAFDSREQSDYMPHTYPRHCVVYTGTHDNDTVVGWFRSAPPEDVKMAKEYLGIHSDAEGPAAFIRAALGSVADLAVIPLQDWLELGSEARVNTPSTIGGNNWRWRMAPGTLTPVLAARIARMTTLYGRKLPAVETALSHKTHPAENTAPFPDPTTDGIIPPTDPRCNKGGPI